MKTRGVWIFVIIVVLIIVSVVAYPRLAGEPDSYMFVVNRDGHYYVGDRCGEVLVEIGVFDYNPSGLKSFDDAVWHAVSDPPTVREIELFGINQPGVRVVSDDGVRPDPMWVLIKDVHGSWFYDWVTLDGIENGRMLGGWTWEEYWDRPDRDYKC